MQILVNLFGDSTPLVLVLAAISTGIICSALHNRRYKKKIGNN